MYRSVLRRSPVTEPRRVQHQMATFSSPSPKKESRRSQNPPPTLAPICINTKTEPRLSPYVATSTATTTFTNATFAPVASPEMTSPGDSGYGYAFSPEQSPRENSLPQIRESSDDSDSAETGSPRLTTWSTSPKVAENSTAAKAKPVKKRDSGRQSSRNRSHEEEDVEEHERNGSEDSYYSDSDFDENDSSGSSSCSRESAPSQRRVSRCVNVFITTFSSRSPTSSNLFISHPTRVFFFLFLFFFFLSLLLLHLLLLFRFSVIHHVTSL